MKKAILTEEFDPSLKLGLEELGYSCDEIYNIDTEGVAAIISEYSILIINSKILVDKNLLDRAPKLETIARIGSGLEIIDMEECKKRNIQIISTPAGNANAVAEHILGFILSTFNNLSKSQNELLSGNWMREKNRGEELCGKTIAIIGCGHNGSRLVNLLSGFDTEVLIYDINELTHTIYNSHARKTDMEEIYKKADIVSFHLPLTEKTQFLFNQDFLTKFEKSIYLINASRGKVCEMDAILYGLESGKIIKAMLDVFEYEPLMLNNRIEKAVKEYKLFLSPHIAGWTYQSRRKMAEIVLKALKKP